MQIKHCRVKLTEQLNTKGAHLSPKHNRDHVSLMVLLFMTSPIHCYFHIPETSSTQKTKRQRRSTSQETTGAILMS